MVSIPTYSFVCWAQVIGICIMPKLLSSYKSMKSCNTGKKNQPKSSNSSSQRFFVSQGRVCYPIHAAMGEDSLCDYNIKTEVHTRRNSFYTRFKSQVKQLWLEDKGLALSRWLYVLEIRWLVRCHRFEVSARASCIHLKILKWIKDSRR
jgi:hypothetical protein